MTTATNWLRVGLGAMVLLALVALASPARAGDMRVLVIGAHPDDPDSAGGTMARYVALGNTVMFVSLTNGDAGHQSIGGGPLALIRTEEARCAGEVVDSEYITLDNHDGELMPTLDVRRQVIQVIREFKPDLVFTPRVDDYHPDHRAAAQLVQDACYLLRVPNVVPESPALARDPVVLGMADFFTRPVPFQADVVIPTDALFEQVLDLLACHESQLFEWLPFMDGQEDVLAGSDRREWLRQYYGRRPAAIARRWAPGARFAEAFERSEYGHRLSVAEIRGRLGVPELA